MIITKNYNLKKPDVTEFYDVGVQNDNMDILDTELKKHETEIVAEATAREVKDNKLEEGISEVNNSLNILNFDEVNIHVATTGNDTTGDGTQTKPYLTLRKAFECIPEQLYKKYSVFIQDGHYLYGNLGKVFNGNGGSISIIGTSKESTILEGCLFISGDFELNIKNINFKHGKNTDTQVNLQKCHGDIDNCIFDGIDKSSVWNFMSALGAMFWILNCTFKNASSGYVCGGGGSFNYFMENNAFDNCDIAIRATGQAIVQNYTEPQYINCAQKYGMYSGCLIIDATGVPVGVLPLTGGTLNGPLGFKAPNTLGKAIMMKNSSNINDFGLDFTDFDDANNFCSMIIQRNTNYAQMFRTNVDNTQRLLYGEHNITVSQSPPTTTLANGCMHNVY